MDFNKKRCLELMKESKKLRQQGTFFWDYDKNKSDELREYFTLISDDIFWQSRIQFFQILEFFVNRRIDVETFIGQFSKLHKKTMDKSSICKKNLEDDTDFQINPQSRGFNKII